MLNAEEDKSGVASNLENQISFGNHNYGTNNEYRLSFFFTLFILLLMICIILGNVIGHRWKWKFLHEAGVTILIGMIAGLLAMFSTTGITASLVQFDPSILFVALLPPIIFNSGYSMKRRFFFQNFTSILAFAIVGTFVSTILFGILLYLVGKVKLSVSLSFAECLTFGSLISATDPVSTLSVFQELRVDPTLFYLVFGESVLNDAVSIVLFGTFSKFIGFSHNATTIAVAVLDFILIFVGSTLIGVFFGCFSSLLFKHYNFKNQLSHEIAVYIMFSYLPFLVSEVVEMSGIVSILFTGITMKHYAHNNLSTQAQLICSKIFNILAHICESAIFLNLGLSVFALRVGYHFALIFWAICFCLLTRALHVYPLSFLLNYKRETPIAKNQQHMLWFSGLRGGISFALALSFPGIHRNEIVATTMVIVLFTVFIMGGFTIYALDVLQIKRLTIEEEEMLDSSTQPGNRIKILQWDAEYFMPFLTRKNPRSHPSTITIIPEEIEEKVEIEMVVAADCPILRECKGKQSDSLGDSEIINSSKSNVL